MVITINYFNLEAPLGKNLAFTIVVCSPFWVYLLLNGGIILVVANSAKSDTWNQHFILDIIFE